jgi:predicted ribosome quality control (RQC) complex YloA/Tae2 family protein
MPFDGIFIKNIAHELNTLLAGGRIGKIHQLDRDAIVLQVRANGENYRLLLSSNPAAARIHLTEKQYDNPETPPVFCMLLRKHLSGGIVRGFKTIGFERIVFMEVETTDELGDRGIKKLVIEIMGRHSNIVLLNPNDKIIDAIKHVDMEVNRVRELLPARTYILPPQQDKLDPTKPETWDVLKAEAPACGRKVESFLLDKLKGFSPVLCREICFRAEVDDGVSASSLKEHELDRLIKALKEMMEGLENRGPSPCLIMDQSLGKPVDFHCIPLTQYPINQSFDFISTAAEAFYNLKNSREFNSQRANDLKKLVEKQLDKLEKRLAINLETYENNKDYEGLRLMGELITANIYALSKGMEKAMLVNYYSEAGETMEIPLDKDRNPQENAQWYFKRYTKARSAFLYAQKEIEAIKSEIAYLESVLFAIDNAEGAEQYAEIRLELVEQGYLKSAVTRGGRKPQPVQALPLRILSRDGFEILVGRNNKQNDKLTFKTARHEDIWLHIKNFSGSHVVIRTGGQEVPDSTLVEAAEYAAYYSQARHAAKVEVDYTYIRNVKKTPGGKPGMVIYVNYYTVVVTPRPPEVS